jgi:hypothetical protein
MAKALKPLPGKSTKAALVFRRLRSTRKEMPHGATTAELQAACGGVVQPTTQQVVRFQASGYRTCFVKRPNGRLARYLVANGEDKPANFSHWYKARSRA